MSILVSGSIAFDVIMSYDGKFKDAILPDQMDRLSVSFFIGEKSQEFGGCGGNIAYNLSMLTDEVELFGRAGNDFFEYEEWLANNSINTDNIIVHEDLDTAVAYFTNDSDGNQIASFYAGAMMKNDNFVPSHPDKYSYAIIAPENLNWMKQGIDFCVKNQVRYIFDPGQQTASLPVDFIVSSMQSSYLTIFSAYEFDLLISRSKLTKGLIHKLCRRIIITEGSKGSTIFDNSKVINVGVAKPSAIVDPTGCGDAYRAGLLAGLSCEFDLELCAKIGAVMGSYAIEEVGTQNHFFELAEFNDRLFRDFGERVSFEGE